VHDNSDAEGQDAGQAADLEYDLAHEPEAAAGAGEPPPGQQQRPQVYVATETRDYPGGDYGYDLAHDVPGRR
jgi:hypothetical protein